MPKTYLLVVAHPDDEILWASALPARYPGIWKCCCASVPITHPQRAQKFQESCKILGINSSYNFNLPAGDIKSHLDFDNLTLDMKGIDHVVTHNSFGEYGHIHHRQLHEFVLKFTYNTPITYFGYGSDKPPTTTLVLTEEEKKRKLQALRVYDARYGGLYYWERILEWLKTLPDYDLGIETYHGAQL